jgi:ferredoxin
LYSAEFPFTVFVGRRDFAHAQNVLLACPLDGMDCEIAGAINDSCNFCGCCVAVCPVETLAPMDEKGRLLSREVAEAMLGAVT